MNKIVLMLLLILNPAFATPAWLNHNTRNYDQQHLKLRVRFNFEQEQVDGLATIRVLPLVNQFEELVLHSETTQVAWIKRQNKQLKFRQENGLLIIQLDRAFEKDEPVEVTIKYLAYPTQGIYFFYPTPDEPEVPYQIWSQGQGENNHYWFPCFDTLGDKYTAEIIATVPDRFQVISNGKLVSATENPNAHEKTFHWQRDYPQVSYLISIIIGEFHTMSDTVSGVPLNYNLPIYRPDADVDLIFRRTPDMFTFFSDYLTPYPYEKYDQTPVHDFRHGGMENSDATTLNSRIIHTREAIPNYSPEMLIAHEMAHQWFGDLITSKSWPHFWLHEGFATYLTDLYFENQYGSDDFRLRRLEQDRTYLEGRHEFPLDQIKTVSTPFTPTDFPGRFAYTRGAAILHALRFEVGDTAFRHGLRNFIERFKFNDAESEDFRRIMEEVSGKDLSQFFKQWIYGAGHPRFKVNWNWDAATRRITIHVEQTQLQTETMGLFEVTVPLEITAGKERILVNIALNQQKQNFSYPLKQKPQMVRFDKGYWLLKEMDFPKSWEELQYQLQFDSDVIGRLFAAGQLAEKGDSAIPVLKRALVREPNHAVRIAVVKSLEKFASPAALEALKSAANDPDARVREAVMEALSQFDANIVQELLKHHFRTETNDYVRAAAVASLGKIKADSAFEILSEALQYNSHKNIIRCRAFEGFKALGVADALPLAQEYTRYKYSSGGSHLLEEATLDFAEVMLETYRSTALDVFYTGLRNPFFRTHDKAAGLIIKHDAKELLPRLVSDVKFIQRKPVQRAFERVIKALVK